MTESSTQQLMDSLLANKAAVNLANTADKNEALALMADSLLVCLGILSVREGPADRM